MSKTKVPERKQIEGLGKFSDKWKLENGKFY